MSDDKEDGPFDLISTDEVFNELADRFDHTLFIGMKVMKEDEDEGSTQYFHRRWEGNAMTQKRSYNREDGPSSE